MEHVLGYQEDGHCMGYFPDVRPALPPPARLQWRLSPACVARISSANTLAKEQIADLDLYVMRHNDFGKGVIKKCKVSPDAFIQMALQMAYFKVMPFNREYWGFICVLTGCRTVLSDVRSLNDSPVLAWQD